MDIGIKVESCINPIKRELIRYATALLCLCVFLAGMFAYHWAWEAFESGIFR
jgi:hypothetical protein